MEIIKTEERTLERRIERIKPKFREREMGRCMHVVFLKSKEEEDVSTYKMRKHLTNHMP